MRLASEGSWDVPYAVAVAVGPQEREVDRCNDLARSLATYEPGPAHLVLVDDCPTPRDLARLVHVPAGFTVASLHHPRHGKVVHYRKGKGICSAILLAMKYIQANTDAQFVLKLDTDSLVISDFRSRLASFFLNHPRVGMVGAFSRTPGGTTRDISMHARNVRKLLYPPISIRHPIRSLLERREQPLRTIRRHIRQAVAEGYKFGEHCLGGGYAVNRKLLDRMQIAGFLDDPSLWLMIDIPEDVMVGMYVRACELDFANYVGVGEVFGVRHIGLPETPERLAANGYAVIHSVKNDPRFSEDEVRSFFRSRRLEPVKPGSHTFPNIRLNSA